MNSFNLFNGYKNGLLYGYEPFKKNINNIIYISKIINTNLSNFYNKYNGEKTEILLLKIDGIIYDNNINDRLKNLPFTKEITLEIINR